MANQSGLYKYLTSMSQGPSTEPAILSQDLWFGYDTALTNQINSNQSVAYGMLAHHWGPQYFACGLWHVGTRLRSTIFCLRLMARWHTTEAHHIQPGMSAHGSVSRAVAHLVHYFDPPYSDLHNIADTLKSAALWHVGTWLRPTIYCLVGVVSLNLCTHLYLSDSHAVSVGHASV